MRKLVVFFLGLSMISSTIQAQKVTGLVKDELGKGLEKTTVSLLRAKDSSVVKLAVTGSDGRFVLQSAAGNFLVSVSHIGYTSQYSAPFEVNGDINLPEILLSKASTNLQGVTITAQKPMIEVRADKTILNVEGTINAVGNDALELLRKSPSVMVDKDDNISLAGKNGVQVFIDGKPSPLSGTDLSNYLKSLQSAQIEAIEIITNPSAKYEAAGNAGIINIKLKKNKSFGANGSVNLGYVQGTYPKYNGGVNLNYRNKSINVFGNYNYNNAQYLMSMNSDREQFDTSFSQKNRMLFHNNTHGFKAGLDYFINNKSTLGAVVNGNLANNDFNTSGPMYFTYIPTGQVDRILKATNNNDMKRDNANANLNYRYAVTGGTELNIDADYGIFKIRSNQYQPNYYFQPDGTTEISRAIYNMIAPTDIDLFSLKADYEKNYKGGRLGIGGKIGIVNTDNDFQRYDVYTSGKVLDTLKSNRFKYKENINALYVNYNKQLKKGIMIQFGLRAENTHSKGTSTGFKQVNGTMLTYDSTFKRDYTDVFPSAAVTFNKNPMKQWTFSYSRRIDRPAYQDLNPFEFKLNEYTFMKGNTLLRPQYTNSFDITHIYKYRLTTKLTYSHVKDIFAQIPDTIDKTKGFMTKRNLATQDVIALNISYPFQYKWYSFFASLNSNYSHYVADFGGGDRKVDQSVFSLTYFMQNSFNLGKGWTGELSGLFISPSVWQGLIRSEAMGSVDAGVQKVIFKGKGNIKVAVSDIFQTMKWGGYTNFAGVYGQFNGQGEMPQFKLNFSYRFGNSQVKAARQRKSALEEERKRAEGGGQQGGMGNQK
ncbi:MAG TPA: outer membrane beta-barrel family protein [Chitinophagaceae bacterium]|nr:outer membrane beta-barrel family protein [Chitinophagaceae bacterium]